MSGNFLGYLIGYVIAIIGVGYGLHAAGVGQQWIITAVLVMIGLGIVYALSRSQHDKTATQPGNQQVVNQAPTNQGGSPPPANQA